MLAEYGCRWGWYWCRYAAILALRLSIGGRRGLHKDSTPEDRKKFVEEIGYPRDAISEPISQQRSNMAGSVTINLLCSTQLLAKIKGCARGLSIRDMTWTEVAY